jgi:hypothetical protein
MAPTAIDAGWSSKSMTSVPTSELHQVEVRGHAVGAEDHAAVFPEERCRARVSLQPLHAIHEQRGVGCGTGHAYRSNCSHWFAAPDTVREVRAIQADDRVVALRRDVYVEPREIGA